MEGQEDGSDSEPDDHSVRVTNLDHDDALGLPWPTQSATFDLIFGANEGSDRLERICVLGQLHRSTFQAVDGEYVRMNRRLTHHGQPVWYSKLNGYYLFINTLHGEIQIFDDLNDDDYFAALTRGEYWKLNAGEQVEKYSPFTVL